MNFRLNKLTEDVESGFDKLGKVLHKDKERFKQRVGVLLSILEKLAKKSEKEDLFFVLRGRIQNSNLSPKKSQEIIQYYDDKVMPIRKVYDKSYNKLKSLSDLKEEDRTVNLSDSFKVGNRKISVKIVNNADFESDYSTVSSEVERLGDQILETNPPQDIQKRITSLQVGSGTQVKTFVLRKLKKTVKKILEAHPDLLRSSNTTVTVILENELRGGGYDHTRSNFSNIVIHVTLKSSMLESTLRSKRDYFTSEEAVWETILHEITHARDWQKNVKRDEVQEAISIFGEEFTKKDMLTVFILNYTREEGVAHLSQHMRPRLESKKEVIDVTEFFEGYEQALDAVKGTIKRYRSSSQELPRSVANALYGTGALHSYGCFLSFLILLNDTKNTSTAMITSDVEKLREEIRNFENSTSFENGEVVTVNKIHLLLDKVQESYINLVLIPKEGFRRRCHQVMNKISLMDSEDFLKSSIRAQKELRFNKSILDKKTVFKRVDRRSLAAKIKDGVSGWFS